MRLLVIAANAFSQTANNGKTYRSFIRSMDKDDVAQLYTGSTEYPDTDCCSNYYRITEFQMAKSMIKFWKPITNSHGELLNAINDKGLGGLKDSRSMMSLKKRTKNLAFIRDLLWATDKWDNKELNNWIINFNPTHVFAVLGNSMALHRIAIKISERYNLPLSVYFTDDYVINDNSTNIIQRLYLKKIRSGYNRTLKVADKAFVIGEKMKKAYERIFRRKFNILINGIHFNESERNPRIFLDSTKSVIISYIGGIHLNRWKTIVNLASILSDIHEYKFDIRVFCVSKPSDEITLEFERYNVTYCGCLSQEGVKEETRKSHIMLHVESFDETNRLYTQYSVSTKIPEYMSSMRGIIAYGPHEIASIQIFSDNNIGCAITDLDSDSQIKTKILNYLSNYNSIDFNGQYEFAKENFNQENMQLENLL